MIAAVLVLACRAHMGRKLCLMDQPPRIPKSVRKLRSSGQKLLRPQIRTRWISSAQVRRERFAEAMSDDQDHRIFNPEFFASIHERQLRYARLYWRLALVSFTISAGLFVSLFVAHPEFSILGIKITEISRLKEPLFFIVACLNIPTALIYFDLADLGMMLDVAVEQTTPKAVWTFTKRKYARALGDIPEVTYPRPELNVVPVRNVEMAVAISLIGLTAIFSITWLAASATIQIAIILSIWRDPSVDWIWGYLVIFYGLLSWAFWIVVDLATIVPRPHRDLSVMMKFHELAAKSREAFARHIGHLERLSKRKSNPFRRALRALKRRYIIKRRYKL